MPQLARRGKSPLLEVDHHRPAVSSAARIQRLPELLKEARRLRAARDEPA
jgi:hypothetical protein